MTSLESGSVFGAPKRRILFLLGAGASADAELPMSFQLSRDIRKAFADSSQFDRFVPVVDYVMAELMVERSLKGDDPFAGIDAERFMAAVRFLSSRSTSEGARFVGAWTRQLEQVTRKFVIPSADTSKLGGHLVRTIASKGSDDSRSAMYTMGHLLARAIDGQMMASGEATFKAIEKACLEILERLLTITDVGRVQYLDKFVNLAVRIEGLNIATLNYDNCIEASCYGAKVPVSVGITDWNDTFQLKFSERGVNLLKLHGSVTWWTDEGDGLSKETIDRKPILIVDPISGNVPSHGNFNPQIIFGEGNKLTHEGPYLQLYLAFRELLLSAQEIVVIGYSFRDDHVNACIRDFLFRSRTTLLTLISPHASEMNTGFIGDLKKERGWQIEPVNKSTSEWIADYSHNHLLGRRSAGVH